jgi:peptide/nickel transport system permease protein
LSISYLLRRIAFFVLVIWLTATLIFGLVHLAPGDPVSYQVGRMSSQGQGVSGGLKLIAEYRHQFGLDRSLPAQYWSYLAQLAHGNLGYSIIDFPTRTTTLIGEALPWTLGLLVTATLIAFLLGTLLGGLMAWPTTPRLVRWLMPGLMVLSAIPYYLIALGLLYFFAYRTQLLPAVGVRDVVNPPSGFGGLLDILKHSLLPGVSIVLATIGFWMLGMRSTMISVLGSDHLLLAEAKGLRERRIFGRYAARTAILPQITILAIWIGSVLSGAILVETIFAYPGLGRLLVRSVSSRDYPVVEGVGFAMVVSVSAAVLLLDLLYPLIDPRIRYERRA